MNVLSITYRIYSNIFELKIQQLWKYCLYTIITKCGWSVLVCKKVGNCVFKIIVSVIEDFNSNQQWNKESTCIKRIELRSQQGTASEYIPQCVMASLILYMTFTNFIHVRKIKETTSWATMLCANDTENLLIAGLASNMKWRNYQMMKSSRYGQVV